MKSKQKFSFETIFAGKEEDQGKEKEQIFFIKGLVEKYEQHCSDGFGKRRVDRCQTIDETDAK